MEDRRSFMKKTLIGSLAMSTPGLVAWTSIGKPPNPITRKNPRKGLVVWYSQTGHTRRIGRLIQHIWQGTGLDVEGIDYREFDPSSLNSYDLIAMGTPVYYMDVPINLKGWIESIPFIEDVSVAAFVTFGGHGDGQHNTACRLLEMMAAKGGTSVGFGMFGNMSTFAPTWSMGNSERILAYKDRPNEDTYQNVRKFASDILEKVKMGQPHEINPEFGIDTLMRAFPQIGFTKLALTDHHIDTENCIECGTCVEKCPVDAIDLLTGNVNSKRCIVCMGCINNCPVQAVQMKFMGKKVYGFNEFLKRNQIRVREPAELS